MIVLSAGISSPPHQATHSIARLMLPTNASTPKLKSFLSPLWSEPYSSVNFVWLRPQSAPPTLQSEPALYIKHNVFVKRIKQQYYKLNTLLYKNIARTNHSVKRIDRFERLFQQQAQSFSDAADALKARGFRHHEYQQYLEKYHFYTSAEPYQKLVTRILSENKIRHFSQASNRVLANQALSNPEMSNPEMSNLAMSSTVMPNPAALTTIYPLRNVSNISTKLQYLTPNQLLQSVESKKKSPELRSPSEVRRDNLIQWLEHQKYLDFSGQGAFAQAANLTHIWYAGTNQSGKFKSVTKQTQTNQHSQPLAVQPITEKTPLIRHLSELFKHSFSWLNNLETRGLSPQHEAPLWPIAKQTWQQLNGQQCAAPVLLADKKGQTITNSFLSYLTPLRAKASEGSPFWKALVRPFSGSLSRPFSRLKSDTSSLTKTIFKGLEPVYGKQLIETQKPVLRIFSTDGPNSATVAMPWSHVGKPTGSEKGLFNNKNTGNSENKHTTSSARDDTAIHKLLKKVFQHQAEEPALKTSVKRSKSTTMPIETLTFRNQGYAGQDVVQHKVSHRPQNAAAPLKFKQHNKSDITQLKTVFQKLEEKVKNHVVETVITDQHILQQLDQQVTTSLFSRQTLSQLSTTLFKDFDKRNAIERYRKGYA